MAKFDPQKDEDCAYLAAALTAYALGLKAETLLSSERGRPIEARARHIAIYLTHVALGMSLARRTCFRPGSFDCRLCLPPDRRQARRPELR
jgi:hypothetical protein